MRHLLVALLLAAVAADSRGRQAVRVEPVEGGATRAWSTPPAAAPGVISLRSDLQARALQTLRGGGSTLSRLLPILLGRQQCRILMVGLDAAGKTTILYKLHIGEVLSTVPTIGFNVEKVQYKNVLFTVWDVGGQEKLRPLWRHYFNNTDGLIYVVDSLDRERVNKAANEFKQILDDPLMRNSAILVFANKQDLKGSLTPAEVCESLGLMDLKGRQWHVQASVAIRGEGLYEGLDWLSNTLRNMQRQGVATSVKSATG